MSECLGDRLEYSISVEKQGRRLVFMSFNDTGSVILDVALLLEILQGSPFHLLIRTILAHTMNS